MSGPGLVAAALVLSISVCSSNTAKHMLNDETDLPRDWMMTSDEVAFKLEYNSMDFPMLQSEALAFPHVHWYDEEGGYNVLWSLISSTQVWKISSAFAGADSLSRQC